MPTIYRSPKNDPITNKPVYSPVPVPGWQPVSSPTGTGGLQGGRTDGVGVGSPRGTGTITTRGTGTVAQPSPIAEKIESVKQNIVRQIQPNITVYESSVPSLPYREQVEKEYARKIFENENKSIGRVETGTIKSFENANIKVYRDTSGNVKVQYKTSGGGVSTATPTEYKQLQNETLSPNQNVVNQKDVGVYAVTKEILAERNDINNYAKVIENAPSSLSGYVEVETGKPYKPPFNLWSEIDKRLVTTGGFIGDIIEPLGRKVITSSFKPAIAEDINYFIFEKKFPVPPISSSILMGNPKIWASGTQVLSGLIKEGALVPEAEVGFAGVASKQNDLIKTLTASDIYIAGAKQSSSFNIALSKSIGENKFATVAISDVTTPKGADRIINTKVVTISADLEGKNALLQKELPYSTAKEIERALKLNQPYAYGSGYATLEVEDISSILSKSGSKEFMKTIDNKASAPLRVGGEKTIGRVIRKNLKPNKNLKTEEIIGFAKPINKEKNVIEYLGSTEPQITSEGIVGATKPNVKGYLILTEPEDELIMLQKGTQVAKQQLTGKQLQVLEKNIAKTMSGHLASTKADYIKKVTDTIDKAMNAKAVTITSTPTVHQSLFYGTGQYEKTTETAGFNFKNLLRQSDNQMIKSGTGLQTGFDTDIRYKDMIRQIQPSRINEIEDQLNRQLRRQGQPVPTRLDQPVREDQLERQLSRQAFKQIEITEEENPNKPPMPRIDLTGRGLLRFKFNLKHERQVGGRLSPAYSVFLKKRGKYVPIGKGLPRGRAIRLGQEATLRSISRTFKIAESGVTSDVDINAMANANYFRGYKVKKGKAVPLTNTFIQRQRTALSSREERLQLQEAKRQARLMKSAKIY